MKTLLPRKKILVLGDKTLALIGRAANASSYVIDPSKCTFPPELKEKISDFGVIIIDEHVYEKCKKIKEMIDMVFENTLIVILPSPKKIRRIDYKKYYEDFVGKTIGLKISF